MSRLKDKVAIITGASSGIGLSAASLFVVEGAKVILVARRERVLKELCDSLNRDGVVAHFIAGDLNDPTTMQKAIDMATQYYGRLDIAFNNAGLLGEYQLTHDTTDENWNHVIQNNLTSAFQSAREQLKVMLKQGYGSILFTSSFVGHHIGFPQMAAYAASKAGLIGLTKVMAAEYATSGIRVNALLPGGTNTSMGQEAASSPEVLEFVKSIHAMKRLAEPDEIAKVALFLVSDDASFITGSAVLADGGVTICKT
ncbi:SDR family oxidoreductase [Acinetobacter seifertii]|uniref:SDR family oxidoreductase n=1 Tax=Acinetobacter seifertii TaxID=1530123 RepID=UPI00168D92F9|nr:SDR family oxidoreductase [Acinetobacter seifertii]QNW99231.1 SDR family oxidoreductase [Acinetobacter seifertii]